MFRYGNGGRSRMGGSSSTRTRNMLDWAFLSTGILPVGIASSAYRIYRSFLVGPEDRGAGRGDHEDPRSAPVGCPSEPRFVGHCLG